VLLLLIAGGALNVAVAWGICIQQSRVFNVTWTLPSTPIIPQVFVDYDSFWQLYGVPLKCLKQDNVALNKVTLEGHRISWNGGIRLDGPQWLIGIRPNALPLYPLWPGFAVNTLFYTGVLWMLFAGPFALRRMIRRRRGRCAQCAYPIGTSEVCTECGAALQPRGNASRSG